MTRDGEIAKALAEYKKYVELGINIDKKMFRGRLDEEEYREFVELVELEGMCD